MFEAILMAFLFALGAFIGQPIYLVSKAIVCRMTGKPIYRHEVQTTVRIAYHALGLTVVLGIMLTMAFAMGYGR